MPKLWLCEWFDGELYFQHTEPVEHSEKPLRAVEVEVNHSLYRQVKAAENKYFKFQASMEHWLNEAEAGRLKRISNGG